MANKEFAERLNTRLDNIDFPAPMQVRVDAFAKLIKIKPFQANNLLHGVIIPDPKLLELIANELEVDADWLMGKKK